MFCYTTCVHPSHPSSLLFFFFNDTATTEIYTLSLHDALPISDLLRALPRSHLRPPRRSLLPLLLVLRELEQRSEEHTSDSSHVEISYAVFCLKKKKKQRTI